MKLDREINEDGKGKYALIQLRKVEVGSRCWKMLEELHAEGVLEWGCVGDPDEFFVIKLRDRYADSGICGYRQAVQKEAGRNANDDAKFKDLTEYARALLDLEGRAGMLSEFFKDPD